VICPKRSASHQWGRVAGGRGARPATSPPLDAVVGHWPALWTFADEDGAESANKAAERALRPAVLWRQGSCGTQSDGEACFVERLLTVVATCKQHGRDGLDCLTIACTAALRSQFSPQLLLVSA
jgi:transposase